MQFRKIKDDTFGDVSINNTTPGHTIIRSVEHCGEFYYEFHCSCGWSDDARNIPGYTNHGYSPRSNIAADQHIAKTAGAK